ncbi:MAG: hypothetical protein P8P30_10415 [Rickettsiales bacterium]|nr:hypothetical protein [Rickettsiales bacterium]
MLGVSPKEILPVSAVEGESAQRVAQVVRRVFGFADEDRIAFGSTGSNEYLSALATASILQKAGVKEEDIINIVFQIEATVPFRLQSVDELLAQSEGELPKTFEDRKSRLEGLEVNRGGANKAAFTSQEIDDMMILSTHFANQDIKNFSGKFSTFMHNTFKIAPELNAELTGKPPTARDYMKILKKEQATMDWFADEMSNRIVHHNGEKDPQYPSTSALENLQSRVNQNFRDAQKYIKMKMVSTHYLQALTTQLGCENLALKEFIPEVHFPQKPNESSDVIYQTLKGENLDDIYTENEGGELVRFDLGSSPLTSCLWEHVGEAKLLALSEQLELISTQQGKEETKLSAEVLKLFNRELKDEIVIPPSATEHLRRDEQKKPLMEGIYESIKRVTTRPIQAKMNQLEATLLSPTLTPPDAGTVSVSP